jgi:hypothetical protein
LSLVFEFNVGCEQRLHRVGLLLRFDALTGHAGALFGNLGDGVLQRGLFSLELRFERGEITDDLILIDPFGVTSIDVLVEQRDDL